MEPTFHESDFIIVDKITPKLGKLERGDIIVFVPEGKDLPFIKRIIGVPGEVVKIEDGNIYICDEEGQDVERCDQLKEYYMPEDTYTSTDMCKKDTFTVDGEGYFVLGDNRDRSTDSRCCFGLGCIDDGNYLVHEKDMIGKVAIRVFPHLEPYW